MIFLLFDVLTLKQVMSSLKLSHCFTHLYNITCFKIKASKKKLYYLLDLITGR